jgi:sugar diacid utilization regulator
VEALAVDAELLSRSERRLVEIVLELERRNAQQHKQWPQAADEEGRARELGRWMADRLEEGDTQSPLPDHSALRAFQYNTCLTLLLDTEFGDSNRFSYKELKRLIDTYFESDNVLIPLSEREWIVLASSTVLEAANEDGELGESTEELVESIALALHEMIIEWLGECRISSSGLVHAPSNLLSAVHNMRGAVRLGRLFHSEEYVHLPWKLHLERLLYTMDDREKKKFLEQLMKNAEHTTLDAEMLTTLHAFFNNDCNISETSKALYIHRNTLLYRLDKFKQATGMDVRNFHDAVLVHMALLLYKVTK